MIGSGSRVFSIRVFVYSMGRDCLLLPTVGPPIKRRAGLRRKQAGRGSYRAS